MLKNINSKRFALECRCQRCAYQTKYRLTALAKWHCCRESAVRKRAFSVLFLFHEKRPLPTRVPEIGQCHGTMVLPLLQKVLHELVVAKASLAFAMSHNAGSTKATGIPTLSSPLPCMVNWKELPYV